MSHKPWQISHVWHMLHAHAMMADGLLFSNWWHVRHERNATKMMYCSMALAGDGVRHWHGGKTVLKYCNGNKQIDMNQFAIVNFTKGEKCY